MKLEKLVIHTGRFLQKCNTHTTISVFFLKQGMEKGRTHAKRDTPPRC